MSGQPLILVVDDDPNFLEIFSVKLSSEGYRVEIADSAENGIQKIKELKPDLVLMDVNMPRMDGAAAVLKLRDDPDTRNINLAFLTSLGDPRLDIQQSDIKAAESFGTRGYLKKTDDLDKLVEQIKALLPQ